MSNYTQENLINIPSNEVPEGTLAIKIGENIFTAGQIAYNLFYKCTSVNTNNNTWSGRKAFISSSNQYEFESDSYSNLSFSYVTPEINGIYTPDALAKIEYLYNKIPQNGLVFYAPFTSNKIKAETGQTLNYSGTVSFENGYLSIPDQYNYVYASDAGFPTSNSDRTICCWMKINGSYSSPFPFLGYGASSNYQNFYLSISSGSFGFDANSYGGKTSQTFDVSKWNFYALTLSSGNVTAFVNDYKQTIHTGSYFNTILNGKLQIGRWCDHTSFYGAMSIKAVRVYDRALTETEVSNIASEFD